MERARFRVRLCDGQLGRDKYDSHNVGGELRLSF
jgi:hypothetical protein